MTRFILEIYEPDSDSLVLATVETPEPITMSVGEIIQTGLLLPDQLNQFLKITSVEHILWQSKGEWRHKKLIFTEVTEPT
jgi:hypothetical protein